MKQTAVFLVFCLVTVNVSAAAAFAEALDKKGNGVTWTFYTDNSKSRKRARSRVKAQLHKKGFKRVNCGASTSLVKGHYAVLFTAYWVKGVLKKRFAFGFSGKSGDDAKKNAVKNLKKHVRGWKKEEGYVVKEVNTF